MHRFIAICIFAALIPSIALADETFRCGSYLVSMPLSVADLLKKCGEPSTKTAASEDVRARVGGGGTQKIGTTKIEKWRYDRAGDFPMIVTVVDGVIESIERGEK